MGARAVPFGAEGGGLLFLAPSRIIHFNFPAQRPSIIYWSQVHNQISFFVKREAIG
jgi:hypothetical protein